MRIRGEGLGAGRTPAGGTPGAAYRARATPRRLDVDDLRRRAHEENFPVALRVLPRRHRDDLQAVYGFARTVDELGDGAPGDSTAELRRFATELDRIWSGGTVRDPVLRRLRPTVLAHRLPAEPFHRLIEANLQDQRVSRYPDAAALFGYCRLSADPVGRIVLGVFGQHDPVLIARSDRVCTALQLLEHCQDVAEDRRTGRIYLPQQELSAYGVAEGDLDAASATPALAALVRFQVRRAAELLDAGAPLVGRLRGWARVCVAGFVAGGQATVAALDHTGGDVLAHTATPSRPGTAARLLRLLITGGGR